MARRLVRDHDQKEHKDESDTPWRPSGSMHRVLLRKRHQKGHTTGQEVNDDQQNQGEDQEEELDLSHHVLELGLIVYVPREAQDEEEDGDEEAKVERDREVIPVRVVVVGVPRHVESLMKFERAWLALRWFIQEIDQ